MLTWQSNFSKKVSRLTCTHVVLWNKTTMKCDFWGNVNYYTYWAYWSKLQVELNSVGFAANGVSETLGNNQRAGALQYYWPGPLVAIQVFLLFQALVSKSSLLTHLQNWGRRITGTLTKYCMNSLWLFSPSLSFLYYVPPKFSWKCDHTKLLIQMLIRKITSMGVLRQMLNFCMTAASVILI